MHELSIAVELVDAAVRHAAANGARKVLRVDVAIGALSGVEPDALAFCFPVAARETACEGARLQIHLETARGTCGQCGLASEVQALMAPCPSCGHWPLHVAGGRVMRMVSLEVD